MSFGVHYAASSPLELVRFSDSDWARDPNDRNSTSGFVFIISNGPICFSNNKQQTISLYLSKVEYREAVNATTQCVWLQGILQELGIALDSSSVIWCENQSEINISTDLV